MDFRCPQFKRCLVSQDGINDVGELVHDSADCHIERFALTFLLIELCQNRITNRAETICVDRIMGNHVKYAYELCEALNVARGTFYNHIFRRADRSKYQEKQQALMLRVQQIFDDILRCQIFKKA